jgi:hemolysin activation/secretion protein
VSTFRRRADVQYDNLLGFGDTIRVGYTNTDGSDDIEANYRLPINARNGSLSFNFSTTSSDIVEPPFDELDIDSKSRNYELTLRQPLIQTAKQGVSQEFALGLTLARRESDTKLLGVGFPLSDGANNDGETRLSVLRFFQDYNQRQPRQVFSARSQFSLGVDWFDATVNGEDPDSRFLAWRGQLLWLRLLGSQNRNLQSTPRLLVRSDLQLAATSLVALEQFSLGGQASVRGYRQDALLTDNGALVSAELQLPVLRTSDTGQVEVIPFLDAGTVWNSSGEKNPDRNFLASVGLGLRWQEGDRFAARLDWGYPLVDIDSRDRTWQENGLYFSLEYNPF